MEIEELEKKRNETKEELKSLLKKYLTDHQRAQITTIPVKKAQLETDNLHGHIDKLNFILGEYMK